MSNGFAVIHHNEYETGVWATESEQAAKDSVYTVMLRWLDDIDEEDQPELFSLIEKGRFHEACTFWNERTEEYFEVRKIETNSETDRKHSKELSEILCNVKERLAAEAEEE